MKRKLFIALLLMLALTGVSSALTASVSNARMVLYTEVHPGETTILNKTIQVNNVNNISTRVLLMARGDLEGRTTFDKNDFILAPNQSEKVTFSVKLTSGGDYNGRIAIGFLPADPNIKATGVGVASIVLIHAKGPVTENISEPVKNEDINSAENLTKTTSNIQHNQDTELNETEPQVTISTGGHQGFRSKTGNNTNTNPRDEADPLIGSLITIFIVILGLIIYFIVSKKYNI